MTFILTLPFLILFIIWFAYVWAELYHGRKSIYTPLGLIVCGIGLLIAGKEIFGIGVLFVGVGWFIKYKTEEYTDGSEINQERERQQIEIERLNAIKSQQRNERIKYMTTPCPYCGHYKVRYAKWEDKRFSVAFWGVASNKLGKHYKCEYCQKMWE